MSLREAERQDLQRSEDVIAMWDFAELSDQELRNPKSISDEQRRWIIKMEADAGLHPNIGKKS